METGREQHGEVVRRILDVSSGQYLDMAADAPTFGLPEELDPDAGVAFLDTLSRRLYFGGRDGKEAFVREPELVRLDRRRHGELCLVTTGQSDEQGRRVYWVCRVER